MFVFMFLLRAVWLECVHPGIWSQLSFNNNQLSRQTRSHTDTRPVLQHVCQGGGAHAIHLRLAHVPSVSMVKWQIQSLQQKHLSDLHWTSQSALIYNVGTSVLAEAVRWCVASLKCVMFNCNLLCENRQVMMKCQVCTWNINGAQLSSAMIVIPCLYNSLLLIGSWGAMSQPSFEA